MKEKESDNTKLFDLLDRLFLRDSFKKTVSKYREKLGVSPDGFTSNEEYVEWLKKDKGRFFDLQYARVKLSKKFDVRLQHSVWLEAYLLLGERFKVFKQEIPLGISSSRGFEKTGYSCALEFDTDFQCVNLKILPGASYRGITKFLREHTGEIKDFLDSLKIKASPIRKKRALKKHDTIYQYYKKGWLTRYGNDATPDGVLLPEDVRNVDMDLRRKIIGEQIKMRK